MTSAWLSFTGPMVAGLLVWPIPLALSSGVLLLQSIFATVPPLHLSFPALSPCSLHSLLLLPCCGGEHIIKLPYFPSGLPISPSFTHQLSSLRYPTHFTRYWRVPCHHLESSTFSTLYSSPSSVITGGRATSLHCSEGVECLVGCSRTMLNTGWICFHVGGSCNLYAWCPTFPTTGMGPYCLSFSFFKSQSVEMLEPFGYTLSQAQYSGAPCLHSW